MTVQSWVRVKELLHRALQLEPARRGQFLDEACGDDTSLRRELDSLLKAGDEVRSSFLASTPANSAAQGGGQFPAPLAEGEIFAERFRLIRKLGEGGMGQVWLAEQMFPVRRQIALKLIKAGMYDEAVVQRFQSERQSLAIMDHPAIAKVFDAGTTPQGQPYFVMEYVPGLPITEYCDRKKLKIGERLELFIQACEGVQHAHQKAILHRDLKPANILVVDVDGKPTPRIIDFGLAKATTPQVGEESMFTQIGVFVGTPGYMSPEQADSNIHDVDTRTDVYSLGVILYVLLAGMQPFETKPKQKPSLEELLRRLREEEPPRPSTKVGSERADSASTADARSTAPRQLASMLRGDLDWITLKALEKDRARRYGTPSELAADIRRHLNHEPVTARPASVGYQLRKYVRRHRLSVAVAGAVVLMLAAFAVLQGVELRRITLERDRANRERDRATRITDFMAGMFKVSDPGQARGNSVTAREILDKASNDIGKGLATDPEAQSQMMQVMSRTYANLGLYSRAQELAKSGLDARMALLGPNDPQTMESMTQLGMILHREGHAADAEKLLRQAFNGEQRVLGPDDPQTLETEDYLASALIYMGHNDEAEKIEREVIALASRKLGPESDRTLHATDSLGTALLWQRRYADAEKVYRPLLDTERRVWGEENPGTLRATTRLATSIVSQGHAAEAEPLDRNALAIEERVLGRDHPLTVDARESLAYVLDNEGHLQEAEKLYRQSVEIRERTAGPESSMTLFSKTELAEVIFGEGRLREAEQLQRETLESQRRVLGADDLYTLRSEDLLSGILTKEGRFSEAATVARHPFELRLRDEGPRHSETVKSLWQLGNALARDGHYAEVETLFRDLIAKQGESGTQEIRWLAWSDFASVAAAAGRKDDALKYMKDAIDWGCESPETFTADDNFRGLRASPAFEQLLAGIKQQPAKK